MWETKDRIYEIEMTQFNTYTKVRIPFQEIQYRPLTNRYFSHRKKEAKETKVIFFYLLLLKDKTN